MASLPPRFLPLQGGLNFRDLGGYRTNSGQSVAFGKVFRAGVLTYLTDSDHALLRTLRVGAICDLRRADERTREPTAWRDGTARALVWDDGDQPPTIRAIAPRHPDTAAGMHAAMCDLYRALPGWLAPRLHDFFACIADGASVIVHCAAGKDRTGIAAALLLAALDVPHEIIVADYLATNDAGDFEQFIITRQPSHHPLLTLPEDIRRVLFAADESYLAAAFDQIASEFGGTPQFLRDHAGISSERLASLRAALLVDAAT